MHCKSSRQNFVTKENRVRVPGFWHFASPVADTQVKCLQPSHTEYYHSPAHIQAHRAYAESHRTHDETHYSVV